MIAFSSGQIYLMTGASSGIGREAALLCNSLGATVIANGRDAARLEAVRAEAAHPDAFIPEERDVTQDMEELPQWVANLRKKYGKFSGLLHCAGYNLMAPFRNFALNEAQRMFDVHYHAPMLIARGLTDRRNCDKGASCVFMSSICAVTPLRMLTIYASAKGALLAGARCMSKELGTQGVRVNCISPALVRTAMTENYSNTVMGYDVLAVEDEIYPLGVSEPGDIAGMIAFLLSSASAKITGQNFVIDGGRH